MRDCKIDMTYISRKRNYILHTIKYEYKLFFWQEYKFSTNSFFSKIKIKIPAEVGNFQLSRHTLSMFGNPFVIYRRGSVASASFFHFGRETE